MTNSICIQFRNTFLFYIFVTALALSVMVHSAFGDTKIGLRAGLGPAYIQGIYDITGYSGTFKHTSESKIFGGTFELPLLGKAGWLGFESGLFYLKRSITYEPFGADSFFGIPVPVSSGGSLTIEQTMIRMDLLMRLNFSSLFSFGFGSFYGRLTNVSASVKNLSMLWTAPRQLEGFPGSIMTG